MIKARALMARRKAEETDGAAGKVCPSSIGAVLRADLCRHRERWCCFSRWIPSLSAATTASCDDFFGRQRRLEGIISSS